MDNQLAEDANNGYQVLRREIAFGAPGQDQDIDTVARAVWALAKRGQELEAQAGASGAVAERTLPGVLPGVYPSE